MADHGFGMPFSWIGQTARQTIANGVDIFAAMADVGVTLDDDPLQNSLEPAESMLFYMLLVNGVDDELHGIARRRMERGTTAMAARATYSSPRLETAIHTFSRFFDMIGGLCRFDLRREGATCVLGIEARIGEGDRKSLLEELLAHTAHIQLSYVLGRLLPVQYFVTPSPRHPMLGRRHPYLVCPVIAGSSTQMLFSASLLEHSTKSVAPDHPVWEAASFWLERHPATRRTVSPDDPTRPASASLLRLLLSRDAPLAECSAELSLSPSELRRSLDAEGGSFRHIRRAALLERVRPHLENGGVTDDIALMLGYSDARSFRRALKLATGLSISDVRARRYSQPAANSRLFARLRDEMKRLEQQLISEWGFQRIHDALSSDVVGDSTTYSTITKRAGIFFEVKLT